MKPIHLSLLTVFTAASFIPETAADDSLSLSEANARALEKHPSLAIFEADRRLADAKILSALAIPNPEVEFETEDVLGSGEYEGFQSAVYNLGLSQLLELGGKRRQRTEVAKSALASEDLRFEAARREVMLETTRLFVSALAAQESEDTASQNLAIASETVNSVKGQQEGGRGSILDVGQSELGLREAQLQLQGARSRTLLSRQRLASLWGDSKPDFDRVSGRLNSPGKSHPGVETLIEKLDDHPLMAMARSGIKTAEQELSLQERLRQPDLNLGLAWRRDTTVDDNAVVINFSLPLPLWNKNEGGIAEAEAGIARSEALVNQARQELAATLAEAVARLDIARAQYELVTDRMLPVATRHHEAVAEGYRLGRISYLELLEARRSLTQVRGQRIEMLSAYHEARIEIEALTGTSL